MFGSVNYLVVLVSAIAAFAIGFLWHGPLFGKMYMRLSGLGTMSSSKKKAMMSTATRSMILQFIVLLIVGYVLSILTWKFGVTSGIEATLLAVLLWLGVVVPVVLSRYLWECASIQFVYFNAAYHLVSLIVMVNIVGLWR